MHANTSRWHTAAHRAQYKFFHIGLMNGSIVLQMELRSVAHVQMGLHSGCMIL